MRVPACGGGEPCNGTMVVEPHAVSAAETMRAELARAATEAERATSQLRATLLDEKASAVAAAVAETREALLRKAEEDSAFALSEFSAERDAALERAAATAEAEKASALRALRDAFESIKDDTVAETRRARALSQARRARRRRWPTTRPPPRAQAD